MYYGPDCAANVSRALPGRSQQPHRAELRALVCALEQANEPLRVRIDNDAVVKVARRLLAGECISDVPDQDLWSRVAREQARLGGRNIQVAWVKGHAQPGHVALGILTQREADHNQEADSLATKGRRSTRCPWR